MYMVFVYMCVCVFAEANMKWVLENEKKITENENEYYSILPLCPYLLD